MQTTLTGRRGAIALLLALAVGVLALAASTAITSAAENAVPSFQADEGAAAANVNEWLCGGDGDLTLAPALSGPSALTAPSNDPLTGICYRRYCVTSVIIIGTAPGYIVVYRCWWISYPCP